jgi:cyclopropane-fatty-acyl-phospholipid synthase
MQILELGCGWGSLTLFMAQKYPDSHITAVSNSSTQKSYIDEQAANLKLSNVRVIKADMNHFQADSTYDRVLSIEMFEHMRNWPALLSRVSNWLRSDGKVFLHFFAYQGLPYLYDASDPKDWMARNFFDAGMMPSVDLLDRCLDNKLHLAEQWKISGIHYQKTLNTWLKQMDLAKAELYPLFELDYGKNARKYWNHWRVFFMSCAEVFGFNQGKDWLIQHNLLVKA